eukprot:1160787-Pelagomonas_calceolata.AAC.10
MLNKGSFYWLKTKTKSVGSSRPIMADTVKQQPVKQLTLLRSSSHCEPQPVLHMSKMHKCVGKTKSVGAFQSSFTAPKKRKEKPTPAKRLLA